MGVTNSNLLVDLAAKHEEQKAIDLLESAYWIDPDFVNGDGDTALHLASAKNLSRLCDKLIEHGCNVNKLNRYDSCALHIAVREGNYKIVEKLLESPNIDVNLEGPYGLTCLAIAAATNNVAIMRRLLAAPNVRIEDRALIFGAYHRKGDEICHLLLKRGANVNATDKYGNTALMQACMRMNESVVQLLLQPIWRPKIEINKQNEFGWTALHFAYCANANIGNNIRQINENERNRHKIIKLLLTKNANPNLLDKNGTMAMDVAPNANTLLSNKKANIIDTREISITPESEIEQINEKFLSKNNNQFAEKERNKEKEKEKQNNDKKSENGSNFSDLIDEHLFETRNKIDEPPTKKRRTALNNDKNGSNERIGKVNLLSKLNQEYRRQSISVNDSYNGETVSSTIYDSHIYHEKPKRKRSKNRAELGDSPMKNVRVYVESKGSKQKNEGKRTRSIHPMMTRSAAKRARQAKIDKEKNEKTTGTRSKSRSKNNNTRSNSRRPRRRH